VQVVETAEEEQTGDLLHHLKRIGDTADQNEFQIASIWLRSMPVSMCVPDYIF
jgi:hypothetical protein